LNLLKADYRKQLIQHYTKFYNMIKPLLVFSAPVSTRSGYGDHARDLALSLIKMDKFDVKIVSMPWGNTPMNALSNVEPNHKLIIDRILKQPLNRPIDVWVQVTVPQEFQKHGKYNIGITAGIETTAIPIEWVQGCNNMDLIIVPSIHAKTCIEKTTYREQDKNTGQVVREHKVTTPVEVLFEGTDTDVFNNVYTPNLDIESEMTVVKEDFNFLFVGHWLSGELGQDRKDVGMLIKTFLSVFKNKKKRPGLILKTSQATFSVLDRERILSNIRDLKESVSGDLPSIYLLHGDLSSTQMNSLFNHDKISAMVSFTKGEGYGRPLQEFMFSGKPIVAPNWSGHVDFLTGYGSLMDGEMTPVHKSASNNMLLEHSSWFTVNYSKAGVEMTRIFKKYDQELKRTSDLVDGVSKKFSLTNMDAEFVKLVTKYVTTQVHVPLKLPTMGLPSLKKL
jgi:glycosyltransferase involved in cell wall biosynthesis